MMKRILLFLILLICSIGVSSATTIYVDTDGSGNYNCNGVDDHVEINYAISNASFGYTIQINDSTYIFNDTINILSNITIQGQSRNNTILKLKNQNNQAQWNHIYGNTVTNVTVQNFTLDGNRAGQTGLGTDDRVQGVVFNYCDNITVQYITSTNHTTDSFKFANTADSVIRNCTAKDSSHDGLYAGGCDGITFADNLVWQVGANGVRFYITKNSIVERNKLYAGDYGIDINTEGSGTYGNNVYRDNYFDNTMFANYAAICLESEGSTILENETFVNNIIATANSCGFYIWTGDTSQIKNITIINNVINDCYHGIYRTGGEVIATNNIITNSIHYGIEGNISSSYNNIWNSGDGDYNITLSGTGDIFQNPLFYNLSAYDFHLNSTIGTWNGTGWEAMGANSPCIDAGKPTDDYSNEPSPNGSIINMGAYGNTIYASKSAWTSTLNKIYYSPTNPIINRIYSNGDVSWIGNQPKQTDTMLNINVVIS